MEPVASSSNDTVYIAMGVLLMLLFIFFVSGSRPRGGAGGTGGGVAAPEPEPEEDDTNWKSQSVYEPTTFTPTHSSKTVQFGKNTYESLFIAKENDDGTFDLMDLSSRSTLTVKKSGCTDYVLYYRPNVESSITFQEDETTENTPEDTVSPSGCTAGGGHQYCTSNGQNITKVYVTMGCPASTNLLKKLVDEGKLSGYDDDRIIKCCETPDVCRTAGITGYPTIDCGDGTGIQGFCP